MPNPADFVGTWTIDPSHSHFSFLARHLMISKTRGEFAKFDGKVVIQDDLADSKIDITIDAASITTHDEKRDAHLRSADFFEVEKYPTLEFSSTSITQKSEDKYQVDGDFTINGISKPVTLEVEFEAEATSPWGQRVASLSARGEINRSDWDLNWNQTLETGGVLVSDAIKLEIDVELVQQAEEQQKSA